jgi:hypothetical protein
MDALLNAIKAAGGDVELVAAHQRERRNAHEVNTTEAILRVYIDGEILTLYVVSSATHVAATLERCEPHSVALARLMPEWVS